MTHWRSISAITVIVLINCISAFTSPTTVTSSRSSCASPKICLFTAIDIQEEAQRDIHSLEQWAITYAGIQQSDGFQLVGEDLDGFLDVSAMTAEDIPANSPALYIPNEMILSSSKAMQEFGRLHEAEQLLTSNGYESDIRQYYLMLKILVELEKGEDSPWFPYLNALPRYFSNGAAMSLFCYTCVPPLVEKLCRDERERYDNLNAEGVHVSFLSDDFQDAKLWKWAYQVVYTRGFEASDGSGDFRIVPMADFFNHATETNVELRYDDAGNCYAQTTEDVPADAPLRMSYGDPTNPSFLLARYGFLDESSPATFCKILPTHVSDEMKNLGYAHDRMLFYKDTGEVSEEVWDILLYTALGETTEDPAAAATAGGVQRQFYRAHMAGDYATKQSLHEEYYPQTAAKLAEHIDKLLKELDGLERKIEYGTKTAAQRKSWSTSTKMGEYPRLPLVLRHNEFVRNTFLTVRSRQGLE